jgi:ABC-type Fe3+-siderophore transport system permease subunit
MRARALSAILVSITLTGSLAALLIIVKHFFFNPELLKNDLVSLGIVFIFALQTAMFYRFNNFWMSALAFTNSYFLVIIVLLLATGGYDSSIKMLLLTCPLVSFVIGGVQEGIQNAVFTIIAGIAIAVFKYIGFSLDNHFAGENIYVDFCVHWTVTVLIIVSCAITYDAALGEISKNNRNNSR